MMLTRPTNPSWQRDLRVSRGPKNLVDSVRLASSDLHDLGPRPERFAPCPAYEEQDAVDGSAYEAGHARSRGVDHRLLVDPDVRDTRKMPVFNAPLTRNGFVRTVGTDEEPWRLAK